MRKVHHIIPTYACNLKCDYCITLDRINDRHSMTVEDAQLIMKRLAKWEAPGPITITWYGGEPMMMGLEFYQKVFEYQGQITEETGVKFCNGIQTNLYALNEQWTDFFTKNKILIRTSLNFELVRNNRQGRNSLELVENNIQRLRNAGIEVRAICTLTQNDNIQNIYEYFESKKLSFKVNPVIINDTVEGKHKPGIEPVKYGKDLIQLFKNVEKHNSIQIGSIDILTASIMFGNRMYSNCTRSVSGITPELDIFPCENLIDPDFKIGSFRSEKENPFMTEQNQAVNTRSYPSECQNCEIKHMCNNGCRNWAYVCCQDVNGLNPFCESFKMISQSISDRILECLDKDSSQLSVIEMQKNLRELQEAPAGFSPYLSEIFNRNVDTTTWRAELC